MTYAERYAISVRKVLVDGQELWRATVRELPDVAEFADSRDEAISLALDTIESLKESADEDGRSFPEPIDDDEEFSGRVTLRLSKSMHRSVAQRAELEGVSLNSYVVECIALRSGALVASSGAHAEWASIADAAVKCTRWYYQAMTSQPVDTIATIAKGMSNIAMGVTGGSGNNLLYVHELPQTALGSEVSVGSLRPWNQIKGAEDVGITTRRRRA